MAEKDAPPQLTVIYSPVDLPWVVSRVLRLIRPQKLALVEAEVWPNLVSNARRAGIPVALVNARLSPRSGRRFHKFWCRMHRTPLGGAPSVCGPRSSSVPGA